ncbi:unnamed protein product [Calicophoron daubneyi]|uniref:IQ calmodulin-binding motif-containing protein 1 n=1 Tax=Calicophoron daubneyi TaxID=300641 RepID=A0AAV2T5E1_CALDB
MDSVTVIEEKLYNLHFTDELSVLSSLMELDHFLVQAPNDERKRIETRLLNSNVPQLLCTTLKQDFSKAPGGWDQASQLCGLLVHILSSSRTDAHPSSDIFPVAVESMLVLLRRLEKHYLKSTKSVNEVRNDNVDILGSIKMTLSCLHELITIDSEVARLIITSPWFLQLFILDDLELAVLFKELFLKCVNAEPNLMNETAFDLKVSIMDELIYHFAVTDSQETVNHTLKCLLAILNSNSGLQNLTSKRYRGIQLIATRWVAQLNPQNPKMVGSTTETTQNMLLSLMNLLKQACASEEQQILKNKELAKRRIGVLPDWRAAIIIQSVWRGHRERKRLRKANESLGKFQRKFREQYIESQKEEREARIEAEFRHLVRLNRRRHWREKMEAELLLLTSLPPPLVDREESRLRNEAAICIQAFYRGYRVRTDLQKRKETIRMDRAARIIQRFYRKHLSRQECLQTLRPENRNSPEKQEDFDEKLMIENMRKRHRAWCQLHPRFSTSEKPLNVLNREVQLALRKYRLQQLNSRHQASVRQVAQARIALDADLLLSELTETEDPSKTNTGEEHGKTKLARAVDSHMVAPRGQPNLGAFFCRTRPLAKVAKQAHQQNMQSMGKPWWFLTMQRWHAGKSRWLKSHDSVDDEDEEVEEDEADSDGRKNWRNWLPDSIFDEPDDILSTAFERTFSVLPIDGE